MSDDRKASPVIFQGGPFDQTIRMVPESHTFLVVEQVEQSGMYEADGHWGALRQFTWKEAKRVHV